MASHYAPDFEPEVPDFKRAKAKKKMPGKAREGARSSHAIHSPQNRRTACLTSREHKRAGAAKH